MKVNLLSDAAVFCGIQFLFFFLFAPLILDMMKEESSSLVYEVFVLYICIFYLFCKYYQFVKIGLTI